MEMACMCEMKQSKLSTIWTKKKFFLPTWENKPSRAYTSSHDFISGVGMDCTFS